MPDIDSIEGRTFGPAIIGVKIDGDTSCYDLGCINSFSFNETIDTRELFCDVRDGRIGVQQFNPRGVLNIEALQMTADNIMIATAGGQTTTGGSFDTTCEKQVITWGGSTGDWTATVQMNHGYISGSIGIGDIYTDVDCSTNIESASVVTVTAACAGYISIGNSATAEPPTTIYVDYTHDYDIPSGSILIRPTYPTTPGYYQLWIDHYMADSDKVFRFEFYRAQLVRNFGMTFTQTDGDIIVPMQFELQKDTEFNVLYDVIEIADRDSFTPGHAPSNT